MGTSQTLLFPRTVTFSPADFAVLRELTEPLHALGFIFVEFGPNTIAVEAIPAGMPAQDEKELLESLIEQFRTTAGPLKLDQRESLARALARRVAAGTAAARLPEVRAQRPGRPPLCLPDARLHPRRPQNPGAAGRPAAGRFFP